MLHQESPLVSAGAFARAGALLQGKNTYLLSAGVLV